MISAMNVANSMMYEILRLLQSSLQVAAPSQQTQSSSPAPDYTVSISKEAGHLAENP